MPRRPKPPPIIIQTVDIASGKRIGQDQLFDDFTGEPLPIVASDIVPGKGLPDDARIWREGKHKAMELAGRNLLERVNIIPGPNNPAPLKPFKRRM
jgi:hypothetical protein